MDDRFARHVATLVASWRAFAAAGGGVVDAGSGHVAVRHPHPVLNNALLLQPDESAVAAIRACFDGAETWAVWTCRPDTARVAAASGLRPDETTRPMYADLTSTRRPAIGGGPDVFEVDPTVVAELNALPASIVAGVTGLSALLAEGSSGVLTFEHDGDLNISFVATRPDARHRGLASAVVAAALDGARQRGLRSATLQATSMGLGLYERLGFVAIGEWQEWTSTA